MVYPKRLRSLQDICRANPDNPTPNFILNKLMTLDQYKNSNYVCDAGVLDQLRNKIRNFIYNSDTSERFSLDGAICDVQKYVHARTITPTARDSFQSDFLNYSFTIPYIKTFSKKDL